MVQLTDEPSPNSLSFNTDANRNSNRRSASTSSPLVHYSGRHSLDLPRSYVPTAAALSRHSSLGTEIIRQSRTPVNLYQALDSPPLISPPGVHIIENSPPPIFPKKVSEKTYHPQQARIVQIRALKNGPTASQGRDEPYWPHGNPFANPRPPLANYVPSQTQKTKILYSTPEIDPDLSEEASESSEKRYLTPSEIRTRKIITRSRFFLRLLSTIFAACVCVGIVSVIAEYRALRSSNEAEVENYADPTQLQLVTGGAINQPVNETHTMIHLAIGLLTLLLTGGMFILSALWTKMRHINPMAIVTNLIVTLLVMGLCIGAMICCMERPGQKTTMKDWICEEKQDLHLLCGEITISFIMSTVVLVLDTFILANLVWSYVFMRKMVRAKAKWETGRRMRRGFEGSRNGSGLGGSVPIPGFGTGKCFGANEEKQRLKRLYDIGLEDGIESGARSEPVSRFSPDSSHAGSPVFRGR